MVAGEGSQLVDFDMIYTGERYSWNDRKTVFSWRIANQNPEDPEAEKWYNRNIRPGSGVGNIYRFQRDMSTPDKVSVVRGSGVFVRRFEDEKLIAYWEAEHATARTISRQAALEVKETKYPLRELFRPIRAIYTKMTYEERRACLAFFIEELTRPWTKEDEK